MPFKSFLTMASSDDSTMAASWRAMASAFSVTTSQPTIWDVAVIGGSPNGARFRLVQGDVLLQSGNFLLRDVLSILSPELLDRFVRPVFLEFTQHALTES